MPVATEDALEHARRRRVVLAALLGVGLLFAGVFLYFHAREPRYLGKTTEEWFPRWVPRGRSPRSVRYPAVGRTNEAPEFVPILVRASRARVDPSESLWQLASETLPNDWLLRIPRPVRAEEIRALSLQLLSQGCHQPEFAARVGEEFDELGPVERLDVLRNLGRMRMNPAPLLPMLDRQLTGADPHLAVLAGWVVSTSNDAARPRAAKLLRALQTAVQDTNLLSELSVPVTAILYRAANWGPYSDGDLRPIESMIVHTNPSIRIPSRMLLARLDPARHSPARLFREELPTMSSAELDEVGKFFRFGFGRRGGGDPGPEARQWMMQVLRAEPALMPTVGSTNAPVPMFSLKTDLVRFLGQSTNHAAEFHDVVLELVDSRDPGLRRAAAEALDRMGPIRPDAVSRIARAVREGKTPVPLMRLLTQYKRLPRELEPLVTDLAEGRLPDDWKPDQLSADAAARRYGLREVRGIGAFRETAKALIVSAGGRPARTPLQSGGTN